MRTRWFCFGTVFGIAACVALGMHEAYVKTGSIWSED